MKNKVFTAPMATVRKCKVKKNGTIHECFIYGIDAAPKGWIEKFVSHANNAFPNFNDVVVTDIQEVYTPSEFNKYYELLTFQDEGPVAAIKECVHKTDVHTFQFFVYGKDTYPGWIINASLLNSAKFGDVFKKINDTEIVLLTAAQFKDNYTELPILLGPMTQDSFSRKVSELVMGGSSKIPVYDIDSGGISITDIGVVRDYKFDTTNISGQTNSMSDGSHVVSKEVGDDKRSSEEILRGDPSLLAGPVNETVIPSLLRRTEKSVILLNTNNHFLIEAVIRFGGNFKANDIPPVPVDEHIDVINYLRHLVHSLEDQVRTYDDCLRRMNEIV